MLKRSILLMLALNASAAFAAAGPDPLPPRTVEIRIYRGRPTPDDVRSKEASQYAPNLEMVQETSLNPLAPAVPTERVCSGQPCYAHGHAPKYVAEESAGQKTFRWPGIANTVEVIGPLWHQKVRWTRRDGDHRLITELPVEYRDGLYSSRTITFEGVRLTITSQPHNDFPYAVAVCPAFGPPPPQRPPDPPLPPRSSVP